ncbi:MAG: hypothetical protein ACI83Q_000302 [Colwellia polaris]|jgi:hypothetical protein
MERREITEVIEEYRDANTPEKAVSLLADELIEELESFPSEQTQQKHKLNEIIRDLEEELHWVENDKLDEFNPEHQ